MADLLAGHLVRPVQFVRQVESMYAAGARGFVEVGPKNVLSGLVDRILGDRGHLSVQVDRPGQPGTTALLDCLAALPTGGGANRVERLFEGRAANRLDLAALAAAARPTHPPGTWLVDGGSARPASAPEPVPPEPVNAIVRRLDRSDVGGQDVST